MKTFVKRLLKGLIYTGLSLFFIFHEYGTNSLGSNHKWGDSVSVWAETQSGFVQGASSLFMFVLGFAALIYLVKGVYFITSAHTGKNPVFENSLREKFSKSCSGFDGDNKNIERIKAYRESKLSTMMNSEAAEEYKSTAWIDSLAANGGKKAQATIRFIDSQLAARSNEDGYNFLKR